MCYSIHHTVFEEIRPFDWIMLAVEVLVLLFVGYGEWTTFSDRRKAKRREAILAPKRLWLAGLIEQGEQLRRDTPREAIEYNDHPSFFPWIQRVDTWGKETVTALERESPKAAIVFNLVKSPVSMEVFVYLPNKLGSPFQLSGNLRVAYERLTSQLANLAEILEKLEVYF